METITKQLYIICCLKQVIYIVESLRMIYYINYLINRILALSIAEFSVLIIIDVGLLLYMVYLITPSIPLGKPPKVFCLFFSAYFWLSFWLLTYSVVNILKIVLSHWIQENNNIYRQTAYALALAIPSVMYVYIFFSSYLKQLYLSAEDLKRHNLSSH